MAFKLVVLDLDGTLLNSQHRISDGNAAAVRACLAQGSEVALASGRSYFAIAPYVRELQLIGPMIVVNGAVIAEITQSSAAPQLIVRNRLDEWALRASLMAFRSYALPHVVFGPDAVYALPGDDWSILVEYGEAPPIVVPDFSDAYIPEPIKVLSLAKAGVVDQQVKEAVGGRADVVRTSPLFLETMPPGANKGAALAEIIARHGLQAEAVLAIGDSYNDLSTFRVAGTSVAMGGAPPEVWAAATHHTASADEDGVALALQRFVLG
jgi:hypothetical protein